MQSNVASLSKLHILEALLEKGYKSDLVGKALNKLVELELTKLKRELTEIETRIEKLEAKYDMDSEEFAEKFHAGLADDSADNIEWISFLDMRTALFQRIRLLQEESA